MNKVLGAQIITDLQTFVAAFEALFGGFRQRATETFQLLSSRHTTFLVVATPQRDALREAAYFVDRLTEEGMPLAGVVINRVHTGAPSTSPPSGRWPWPRISIRPRASVEIEALRRHAEPDAGDREREPGCWNDSPRPGRRCPRRRCQSLAHRRHRPRVTSPRRRSLRQGLSTVGAAAGGLPTKIELHEVTSVRCRSSSRRSRSVMPPQTPHSIRLSSASARHSKRTGQPEHSATGPLLIEASGNSASPMPRHLASMVQSSR